ncbi:MAG: response regulator [Candidatus Eremiobacterota bacterium]
MVYKRKRILIVDDEFNIRRTLSDILTFRGYETISTDTGEKALEMAEKEKPCLVLLDMKLEDMSGLDILKYIKEKFPFMECIILTGYASQSSAIKAVNLGAYGYIQKPYEIEQLIIMIKRAIEKIDSEEALKESENRYKTLFDNASDAIFIHDPEGNFLDVNQVACERLGYTKEELLKMKPLDIDTPEYGLYVKDRTSQALLNNQMSFESAHICKDGKIIPVEIKSRMIDYRGKNVILSAARDITERKEAEQEREKLYNQLFQIQKMDALGLLAGGIAHDFNNILSGIIGYSELALCEVEYNSPVRLSIQKVLKASNRAKELAKQILTFSRNDIEEKKSMKPVSVVREAITFIRATLPSTIQIKESIKSKNYIKGDPGQIYQVILNLCTNAGHAMKNLGGTLEISLSDTELVSEDMPPYYEIKPGAYIKLSVKDTGHGMEKAVLERIFEPFFTTKERGEGTGMGLSVVHGIVKNHGGFITVYSEPEKGTVFNIFFPSVNDTETVKEETCDTVVSGKGRILFVDDEKDIAAFTEQMLTKLGYTVTAKTSAPEALDTFKSNPHNFDLLITDYTMPELTGLSLCSEILKIRPDMPVIICTGLFDFLTTVRCAETGIKDILEKPVGIKKLSETVQKFIKNGRE